MSNAVTFAVFTVFFAGIAIVGPIIAKFFAKGANTGVIQTMIVMISACCYMFWALAFLHQINPLLGPELNGPTVLWLGNQWGYTVTSQP